MPYKKKEKEIFEYGGKKIAVPQVRQNKYRDEIVHIGAEIPLELWKQITRDAVRKSIPFQQNVRQILSEYYADRNEEIEKTE